MEKRKGIPHILLFMALFLVQISSVWARQSATAVMEVRVEIISAVKITTHLLNISSQLQDTDEDDMYKFSVGRYNVTVPDGARYLISSERSVTLSGTEGEMLAELDVRKGLEINGRTDFFLSGRIDAGVAVDGHYVGEYSTRIEYN